MLSRTILDLRRILIATARVDHTDLVLSRNLCGLSGTLPGILFALGVRTIGDTLVFVTLLEIFAAFVTLTLRPNSALALLRAFLTSVAVFGQTTS